MSILHFIENLRQPQQPQPQRKPLPPVPGLATHVFGGAVPPEGMVSAGPFDYNRGNANFMQLPIPQYNRSMVPMAPMVRMPSPLQRGHQF